MEDEWMNTELWNFVHAAALELNLSEDSEQLLHRSMAQAIVAHDIWKERAGD
jgi:hypothetical protein